MDYPFDCITDFIFVKNSKPTQPCEVILIPGSSHPQLMLGAIELYNKGMAKYIVVSGGENHKIPGYPGEAEFYKSIAIKEGVPPEPVFLDDVRVNAIQLWDYNADDSMTFHLLYTFEKENKFFQKEEFEEHYIPVKREIILKKLVEMDYQDIKLMCHPACFEGVDAKEADWYCVMARKN